MTETDVCRNRQSLEGGSHARNNHICPAHCIRCSIFCIQTVLSSSSSSGFVVTEPTCKSGKLISFKCFCIIYLQSGPDQQKRNQFIVFLKGFLKYSFHKNGTNHMENTKSCTNNSKLENRKTFFFFF